MDSNAPENILTALAILISGAIFLFVLTPRFNKWPDPESCNFTKEPKDYISLRKYLIYGAIYLATYAVIAIVASAMGLGAVYFFFSDGETPLRSLGILSGPVISIATQNLEPNSFSISLMLVTLAVFAFKKVSRLDDAWRTFLLDSARVPAEANTIRNEIIRNFQTIEYKDHLINKTIAKLGAAGDENFWRTAIDEDIFSGSDWGNLVVNNLYMIQVIRQLNISRLDRDDIERHEQKILTISESIPDSHRLGTEIRRDDRNYLESSIDTLVEILATRIVKNYTSEQARYCKIIESGIMIDYIDDNSKNTEMALFLTVVSIIPACAISIMLGLYLYDAVGIPLPLSWSVDHWFNTDTIVRWSVGACAAYIIAVGTGVFFSNAVNSNSQRGFVIQKALSFIFAAFGSSVFFIFARENFSGPFFWLALNFGLAAIVTVLSIKKVSENQHQDVSTPIFYGLIFGAISGFLQIAVSFGFRVPTDNIFGYALTYFIFGFLRGAIVLTTLSFMIMELFEPKTISGRRKSPRATINEKVAVSLDGGEHQFLVKDISEKGVALEQVGEAPQLSAGDWVCVALNNFRFKGKVISPQEDQEPARVEFEREDINNDNQDKLDFLRGRLVNHFVYRMN